MLLNEIKNIKSSKKDLKNFGIVVGAVFLVLGFWFSYLGRSSSLVFVSAGAMLMFLGLAYPKMLKPVYRVWMAIAVVMGLIMTNVILAIFFYLAVTPFALILRLSGKHFLNLGLRTGQKSYWNYRSHETDKVDLEKQF